MLCPSPWQRFYDKWCAFCSWIQNVFFHFFTLSGLNISGHSWFFWSAVFILVLTNKHFTHATRLNIFKFSLDQVLCKYLQTWCGHFCLKQFVLLTLNFKMHFIHFHMLNCISICTTPHFCLHSSHLNSAIPIRGISFSNLFWFFVLTNA